MANSVLNRPDCRVLIDIPNASVIAVNAAISLHLAVRGLRLVCRDSEPSEAQLEALVWLGEFTCDAAEATMALANEMPARWPLFPDEQAAATAVTTIAA